jgi:serine/threonine protein kinase
MSVLGQCLLSREDITFQDKTWSRSGGYGTVHKCSLRTSPGRIFAVKRLSAPHYASGSDPQKSFIREIVVPQSLKLPGIVPLVGFCFPGKSPGHKRDAGLIVTELMPNGSLDRVADENWIRDPPRHFGPTQFSKCFFGIAATMAQLHKCDIIHRDLKPGNIVLDDKWEPRICDFGLARTRGGIKKTANIGSPFYMAPELFGDDEYGFPADVYAFGMTLYHVCLGESVFHFSDGISIADQFSIIRKIPTGKRYKKPDGIHEPIWELIKLCWAEGERPTFEDIVNEMLGNDGLAIPGTNLGEYHEYQRRIMSEDSKCGMSSVMPHGSSAGSNGLYLRNMVNTNADLRVAFDMSREKMLSASQDDPAFMPYDFLAPTSG